MRLWWGEYTDDELERAGARGYFLEAIEQAAPEVLKALRDDVLSHYGEPDSHAALEAWAARFNLNENWLLEQALSTLNIWRQCPFMREEPLEWGVYPGGSYWSPVPKGDIRLVFGCRGWDPVEESRATARERIEGVFQEYLAAYLGQMERLAEEREFKRSKEKRARSGADPLLHFKWLVRYQVQEWDYDEITQELTDNDPEGEASIGVDAVRKAIVNTARLMELRLR